jgi:hypothetical protein
LDVRLCEIVTDKQQRLAKRSGQRINGAIAKVELGGMPLPFTMAQEGHVCDSRLTFIEWHNDSTGFFQETL